MKIFLGGDSFSSSRRLFLFKGRISLTDPKLIDKKNWNEHYIKRGDPKKPTYYIIRRQFTRTGLFSNFVVFAGHIRYALSNGWLPVIDMQNYENPYLPPEKLGKENAWEYYFEQPLRIGLEQAYSGKNIILSYGNVVEPYPNDSMAFFENRNGSLTEWRMLVKMGLLKIKPELMEEISAVREKLFPKNEHILGVSLRGTDYTAIRPDDHPIQPPLEFALSTVSAKLREWQYTKIFLATEDKIITKVFKKVFKELCFTIDREYVDYTPGKWVTFCRVDRENDYFLQGKEYLTELVLLSQCTSFIAARCSGTVGVMMLAEHFEHTYFFNLGRYGMISLD